MEKFRLTKAGRVQYEDKVFKHMNHRSNYVAKREREGYEVQSMSDYDAKESDQTRFYVIAQEDAMFEMFNLK